MALHAALAYTAHITPSLPPTSLVTKAVRLHLHAAHHPPSYASGCCLRAGGKGAGCIYGQHLILVGAKDYSTTLF